MRGNRLHFEESKHRGSLEIHEDSGQIEADDDGVNAPPAVRERGSEDSVGKALFHKHVTRSCEGSPQKSKSKSFHLHR